MRLYAYHVDESTDADFNGNILKVRNFRMEELALPTLEHCSSDSLTPREIEIVTLIRRGLRNREIGEVMGISEQDTKNRLRKIFDKLGVWSRLEVAMWVVDRGSNWPPR